MIIHVRHVLKLTRFQFSLDEDWLWVGFLICLTTFMEIDISRESQCETWCKSSQSSI